MYKITQSELAKVLETSQKQISRYEVGERKLNEEQIKNICEKYNVTPEIILGIQKEEPEMETKEFILKVGKEIQETNGKVNFTDIIKKYESIEIPKLNNTDIEIIKLFIYEHNMQFND